MKRLARALALVLIAGFAGCTSQTNDPLGVLGTAADLSGRWLGVDPNGAVYWDDEATPNCSYEADIELELVQRGDSLGGTITLTIRDYSGPMTAPSTPCTDVGTVTAGSLTGMRSGIHLTFTLEDGVTVFSGTCTSDILSGELVVNSPGGVKGTWTVVR